LSANAVGVSTGLMMLGRGELSMSTRYRGVFGAGQRRSVVSIGLGF